MHKQSCSSRYAEAVLDAGLLQCPRSARRFLILRDGAGDFASHKGTEARRAGWCFIRKAGRHEWAHRGAGIFACCPLRVLGALVVKTNRLCGVDRDGKFHPKCGDDSPFSGVENLAFSVKAGFAGTGNVAESLSMGFSGAVGLAFSVEAGFSRAGNVAESFRWVFRESKKSPPVFRWVFTEPKFLLSHFHRVLRESEKSLKHFGQVFREAEKALSHVQCVYFQDFPPAALRVASLQKCASGRGESGGEFHQ